MKKMKNSLALLIVLSLITTAMVNVNPVYSISTVLRTEIKTPAGTWTTASINQYTPGQIVTVRITVEQVTKLTGFEFKLKYDPNVLIAKSVVLNTLPPGVTWPSIVQPPALGTYRLQNVIDNNVGLVWYAFILSPGTTAPYSTGFSVTTAKQLVTITFEVGSTLDATLLDLCGTKLTALGGTPISHEAKDAYFTDAGVLPVAIFTVSDTAPEWHEKVTFDASSSYSLPDFPIVSYYWDFGDGTTATDIAPIHNYGREGTYTVTLTVTNTASLSDSATATITVVPRVVDLFRKKAWPEHHNYSISKDENSGDPEYNAVIKYESLFGMVTNYANVDYDARVVFTLYNYTTGQMYRSPFKTAFYTLAPGEITILEYDLVVAAGTLNPDGTEPILEPMMLGTFLVRAHAQYWDDTINKWMDGAVAHTFTILIIP